MDADMLVVSDASDVFRVCAGKAAIARIFTGIGALMRVPVVSVTETSNSTEVIKSIAVIIFIDMNSINSMAY